MAQPKPKPVQHAQPQEHAAFSTGRVLKIDSSSNVTVDVDGQTVVALLATHVPPPLPGQRVVVMHVEGDVALISAAYPLATQATGSATSQAVGAESSAAAMSFDPATGTLSIQAKQLNLQGMATIEIRCGESVLRFNAQGEVFMQAEAITQSAIGAYQIEGASIDLN
jgi:hypothetical protein